MELLITYDVTTTDAAGRKRLRQVAHVCEAHGQRVQKSVFECTLNQAQVELFRHSLEAIVDEEADSLRIYRLREPREEYIEVLGKPLAQDLNEPLIL